MLQCYFLWRAWWLYACAYTFRLCTYLMLDVSLCSKSNLRMWSTLWHCTKVWQTPTVLNLAMSPNRWWPNSPQPRDSHIISMKFYWHKKGVFLKQAYLTGSILLNTSSHTLKTCSSPWDFTSTAFCLRNAMAKQSSVGWNSTSIKPIRNSP